MTADTANDGSTVVLHYVLTDERGRVRDRTDADTPIEVRLGDGAVVVGLERALVGRRAGERFEVTVDPEDGFGERRGPAPTAVSRASLPEGMEFERGMQITTEGPGGRPVPLWITRVTPERIFVDLNHPLADETLHYAVEVVAVL